MPELKNTSSKNLNVLVLLINLLFIYSWISVNIYLPALPSLGKVFSTSEQNIKLSISLFLIGFAVSQLFWGSLSERYGRKIPLLVGMIICCVGVLLSLVATHIWLFNMGRFIEAFGVGCAPTLGRAILTDSFHDVKLAQVMSYAATSANIMPFFAPIIGGYIFLWLGWRWIFAFLLILGLSLLFIFSRYVTETHLHINRNLSLKNAITQYGHLIKQAKFWSYLIPYALLAGGMLGYYAAAPFIFIQQLHLSAQTYPYLLAATVISYCAGSALTRLLAPHFGIDKMLLAGILCSLASAVLAMILAFTTPLNAITALFPATIFMFGVGAVSPNANAGAMSTIGHIAGAGGAVIVAIVYGASSILTGIITAITIQTPMPLAVYFTSLSIMALASFLVFKRIHATTYHR